jgi:hypothetical protein
MINPVYDFSIEQVIELRPYMRYSSSVLVSEVTEEQWESASKNSVSEEEYVMITKSRLRG